MAQVDKLNYFPNLFWFILLFILTYFIMFCYILPFLYSSLKIRNLFFNLLIRNIKYIYIFSLILNAFYTMPILKHYIKLLKYLTKCFNNLTYYFYFNKS